MARPPEHSVQPSMPQHDHASAPKPQPSLIRRAWRVGLPMWLLASTVMLCTTRAAWAADLVGKESITNRPLLLIFAMAVLSMAPFVIVMVTSFVKIAVVLSMVRQAIGTQQIPPTQVVTGMATILTVYIMMPVGLDTYHRAQDHMLSSPMRDSPIQALERISAQQMIDMAKAAQMPLKEFLIKHSHERERQMFYRLAWRMLQPRDRATLTDVDWMILIPAFVTSELKEAFQIGFILFVPFLVIDMVVSNILMALGMQMLSPTTISLPFKILLFVVVDGWYLITKGLVLGYM